MALAPGIYARFTTNHGNFLARLFAAEAPKTVENFVGLAEGTKEFLDPKTRQKTRRPFYDGLIFHRVIPDFMIQGGDPLGSGVGGPGYQFADEFHASLNHGEAGMLSMANSGPNTNGSQFFITVAATPWLDRKHSVFGKVVEGLDVVQRIAAVPRDRNDRPREAVTIERVTIERVG
ncbi:MAG TPA: peptidylprolyl isomerase [Terriglobales bacterium]|nr:peptidylprolyl isomerase [Terriglobales bacterium]